MRLRERASCAVFLTTACLWGLGEVSREASSIKFHSLDLNPLIPPARENHLKAVQPLGPTRIP